MTGDCLVETTAEAAPIVLDVVRTLELPLALAFNRSRLMILPQAVSKATGLREALAALRLSAHNTLAIGDAENDHALLEAAEVGVAAVGVRRRWLRRRGSRPRGARTGRRRRLPARARAAQRDLPATNGRRQVLLGHDPLRPLALAVRDRNVLVSGDPRSGKSWVAGLLSEQLMLARYAVAIVDPEGDYRTLEALPGVHVAGEDHPPGPGDLERAFRFPDSSLIVDLSHVGYTQKLDCMSAILPALARPAAERGLPHRIVVDEAHYFLRDARCRGGPATSPTVATRWSPTARPISTTP